MEKEVILGSLESGLKRDSDERWYRVNYLDISSGRAIQDYFENVEDYKTMLSLKLPIGSRCIGLFTANSRRMVVLYAIKSICKDK